MNGERTAGIESECMREHKAQRMYWYGTRSGTTRGTHEVAGGTQRKFKWKQGKCAGSAEKNVRGITSGNAHEGRGAMSQECIRHFKNGKKMRRVLSCSGLWNCIVVSLSQPKDI